ncbi:MAG: dephospho-CoA kinase [Paludibacteraceae bacterium]|nr:dephospho-CoA kinase [Paludibacteraceae bacterium]
MKRVGITGGIGSGKTFFCHRLEAAGLSVFYADIESRRLLENDERLKLQIKQLLGEESYNGELPNRSYIASRIFQDPTLREQMNALVHPRVLEAFEQWCGQRAEDGERVVLMESAILFESGFNRYVDTVVVVSAPENERLERTIERDHTNEAAVRERMAAQWSEEKKAAKADFILSNSQLDDANKQIFELLKFLEV